MVLHVRVAVVRLCLSKRLSSKVPLAEVVQAEKLTKLAQLQQPTHLMQNLPNRTAITGAGMFILQFLKVLSDISAHLCGFRLKFKERISILRLQCNTLLVVKTF